MRIDSTNTLEETVINGGYCIGCGACASFAGSPFKMEFDEFGMLKPKRGNANGAVDVNPEICPFYTSVTEDDIAEKLYSESSNYDKRVGYYRSIAIGHVSDSSIRSGSSSGGIVTWLLAELLRRNEVDAVIHVGATKDKGRLFEFHISSTEHEVFLRSKSRYYPVEFSEVIKTVASVDKRFAFVGVPCHVKAIRLLMQRDDVLKAKIPICISLFCGHMKSAAYSQFLSWQLGIDPQSLEGIDFRKKLYDRPANKYAVTVKGHNNQQAQAATMPVGDLWGTNWGLGLFKPKACDFCDDVAGEVADITCGDAWLPDRVTDPAGTSVIIVRSTKIEKIIDDGVATGALQLDKGSPQDVYQSQAGNYRHRHEGLSWRISHAEKNGQWCPPKRIRASQFDLSWRRRMIYRVRSLLSLKSHSVFCEAKSKESLLYFRIKMTPLEFAYHLLSGSIKGYLWLLTRHALKSIAGRGGVKRSIRSNFE